MVGDTYAVRAYARFHTPVSFDCGVAPIGQKIICERSQSRTMGSILISPPLIFGVRAGAIARWTGSPAFSRGSRDRSSRDAPVVEIPPPSRIVFFNYLAGSPRFGARLAQSARNTLQDKDFWGDKDPGIRIYP